MHQFSDGRGSIAPVLNSRTAMGNAFGTKRAGPPHIHALSDDLLLRILKEPVLDGNGRLKVLPLVCKRWAQVALLALESAVCDAEGQHCSTRLLALSSWLAQHAAAGSLRRLEINVCPSRDGGALQQQGTRALLLHSVLPACTRLHELEMHLDGMGNHALGLEGWAANLPDLQCLAFYSDAKCHVTAQLQRLTRMQELALAGNGLIFSDGAVLPPFLTKLSLESLQGQHLPAQLYTLTTLHSLTLNFLALAPDHYDGLTALTWLKRLQLIESVNLPSCLSALTHLSELSLDETPSEETAAVMAAAQEEAVGALPNLVHLTLVVDDKLSDVPRLPATLEGLSRLQSLVLDFVPASNPALPPGPYLASLTRLVLHTAAVVPNLQQLSAQAGQLAELTLLGHCHRAGDAEGRVAVVSWAAGHTPLRCLRLGDAPRRSASLNKSLREAQQRKPQLHIQFPHYSAGNWD